MNTGMLYSPDNEPINALRMLEREHRELLDMVKLLKKYAEPSPASIKAGLLIERIENRQA